jgi:hypothetical protein
MIIVVIGFNGTILDQTIKDIDDALDESIDDLLTFIDNVQAKAYTQDANPSKPGGSRYQRTFNLQNSTEKVHVLKFQGEWISDIDYARYVLGSRSEQAEIHRGRWKAREIVEQETMEAASRIINDAIARKL